MRNRNNLYSQRKKNKKDKNDKKYDKDEKDDSNKYPKHAEIVQWKEIEAILAKGNKVDEIDLKCPIEYVPEKCDECDDCKPISSFLPKPVSSRAVYNHMLKHHNNVLDWISKQEE